MSHDKLSKYMAVTAAIGSLSKDQSTKVGALIIGKGGEFIASGWNGAPRGCAADEPGDIRGERPEKYFWFSHAESNAITNAARVGTPLAGGTIVVTHFPCMDCARAIVQAGLVKVVTNIPEAGFSERWEEHISRSLRLFDECGVEIEYVGD
jgi:dCMP deaminase